MTPEMIVATCAGIVSIVAAIGALIESIRNGRAIAAARTDAGKAAANQDVKAEQIHVLVNSRLSQALEEIARLRDHVANLTAKPGDAALADKAAVDAGTPRPVSPPAAPPCPPADTPPTVPPPAPTSWTGDAGKKDAGGGPA